MSAKRLFLAFGILFMLAVPDVSALQSLVSLPTAHAAGRAAGQDHRTSSVETLTPAGGPVVTLNEDQQNSQADGDLVVWEDDQAGNWDIFAKDLATEQIFPVYQGAGDQRLPGISGNLVVWQDNSSGIWAIYGARLSNDVAGPPFIISAGPNDQTNPTVTGEVVAWEINQGGRLDIRAVDLAHGVVQTLSDPARTSMNPAIDGSLVVWQSTVFTATNKLQVPEISTQWDIYGKFLGGFGPFPITDLYDMHEHYNAPVCQDQ